jgi:hypothetical protein
MKPLCSLFATYLVFTSLSSYSQEASVSSPDKQLTVSISVIEGIPYYSVRYKGKISLDNSPLGLKTNEGDFSVAMKYLSQSEEVINKSYTQDRIKKSSIQYQANKLSCSFENAQQKKISVVFQVSNNDVAFRYELPIWGPRMATVIDKETTGFKFPTTTTTYLSAMMPPMSGFARTTPSYESAYEANAPLVKVNPRSGGYVFPGLFKIGENGWVLLSETGVGSQYCGSHLSEYSAEGIYTIEYPDQRQNNGFGSTSAAIALPGATPWRTITVSDNLKHIVETTISYDLVDPLYEASQKYKYGRAAWSWIVWQDNSMNYDDQVKYVDMASALSFEYILIDALWDSRIGKEKMQELIKYAGSKNVEVFLWYNSNGPFNDAPQGPRNRMHSAIERKKEMKWLQSVGVKGLKVDFFGGDKQESMRLYEDILSDANDYGLMVDFHGATLPRGWERMYPNYVGSEAVVASEMLVFTQGVRDNEAFNATIHPYVRNAVASMEFGGVFLNRFLTKSNQGRNKRLTTDAFQLATAILFQNPVQMFALTPNNLTDAPDFAIDFMKTVPTTWDETLHIDGYPGKYSVLARRHGDQWFIAGVNGGKEVLKLTLKLPMLAGKKVSLYNDDSTLTTYLKDTEVRRSGEFDVEIQPGGGFILK